MPNPTNSNRLSFKTYLRANKRKFTSGIQTCILGDIQNAMLSISAGVDTSQITRVIIFDDNERVGLSTVLNERQLFYVPALPDDSIIIGVGTDGDVGIKSYRGYELTFVGDGQGVRYGSTTYGLNSTIGLGTDVSLTILGLGGGLFLPGDPPSYSVTPSSTDVYEGQTVSFAVTTTNIGVGTVLYYSIVGSATSTDFTDNSLTGSFPIEGISNNVGFATFTKTIKIDDNYSETIEGFRVNILTGSSGIGGDVVSTSSTVFITNLGQPTYSIGVSTTTVNEGDSVDFTVNTVNVGAGTTLYYNTSGSMESADFFDNSLTGSLNIIGTGVTTGIATVTRTIANDFATEGTESFALTIRTGSATGPVVVTSESVTVNDVVPTVSISESTTTVDEGSSVTFTITATGFANGTVLYWTTYSESGVLTASDFADGLLSGSVTLSNGTASITRALDSDRSTESVIESFRIQIRRDSVSGTVVATSDIVTIGDTSKNISEAANGLTFGPVQVNRDGGNDALASDWYTICGIDNLPEGSSIALFIDTSGSMTQTTIQASYDLLVQKLNEKNITITSVTNPNEDWITPFLVDLP